MVEKKIFPKDRAMENFDDFYGSVFGTRWKSIRIGLLCEHKYIALVNNFGDTEETINSLEAEGAINVRSLYKAGLSNIKSDDPDILAPNKVFKIDQKLDQFIQAKRQDEISSVYPSNVATEIPEGFRYNRKETENSSNDEEYVDYKKPLEQTIKEDSDLDYRRMVDSDVSPAALHEFIPATKIKGMEDWIFDSDHYKYYSNSTDFPINIEMETELNIPENLHIFTYEKGNCSTFVKPKKGITGVLSHFLMDGASILPPLMLNVQPGDKVLDACAAPGGKSLLMLQSLHPEILVCNDLIESRTNRIKKIMYQYLYDFEEKWNKKRCFITQEDARVISDYGSYDKILVDVPCTTDRHSVNENDNNIFKPTRIKERLRLPELQAGILSNCIRLLKPGGSLVYSTCSLSPVQNDGVVHMALSRVFTDHEITATVKDLSLVVQPLNSIYKFENPKGLKYGQMVLPYLNANFGPMYFSKITRNI